MTNKAPPISLNMLHTPHKLAQFIVNVPKLKQDNSFLFDEQNDQKKHDFGYENDEKQSTLILDFETTKLNPNAQPFDLLGIKKKKKNNKMSTIYEAQADGIRRVKESMLNDLTGPGRVKISAKLTNCIIPARIEQKLSNIYYYMNQSLMFKEIKHTFGDMVVINYDFRDKSSKETLYCVIRKFQNKKYRWKMVDELFTDIQMEKQFNIARDALPQSISFNTDLLKNVTEYQKIKRIITQERWQHIPVYSKVKNRERKILSLSSAEFKRKIAAADNLKNINKLVPIIRINKHNEYWIEHLWIVEITCSVNIGISLSVNPLKNKIEITGIHLDKEDIIKSHALIPFHDCHCLDNFNSLFDDLKIGDIDAQLKKQLKSDKFVLKKLKTNSKIAKQVTNILKSKSSAISANEKQEQFNVKPMMTNQRIPTIATPNSTNSAMHIFTPQIVDISKTKTKSNTAKSENSKTKILSLNTTEFKSRITTVDNLKNINKLVADDAPNYTLIILTWISRLVPIAAALIAFIYLIWLMANSDNWSTNDSSDEKEKLRREAARAVFVSVVIAILLNCIGAFMFYIKVRESLVVINYGFMLEILIGKDEGFSRWMLDHAIDPDEGFKDVMTSKGFSYTFSSLIGNFMRYIVTVFLDLFISNPLQDHVLKVSIETDRRYDSFVAMKNPSILQSIVAFVTFNAFTNQARFVSAFDFAKQKKKNTRWKVSFVAMNYPSILLSIVAFVFTWLNQSAFDFTKQKKKNTRWKVSFADDRDINTKWKPLLFLIIENITIDRIRHGGNVDCDGLLEGENDGDSFGCLDGELNGKGSVLNANAPAFVPQINTLSATFNKNIHKISEISISNEIQNFTRIF